MTAEINFNLALIKKYDKPGPRYTSYPTAVVFNEEFRGIEYQKEIACIKPSALDAVSLYIHIPFCDTLCYFCACNKIPTKDRSKADIYLDYLDKEMALLSEVYGKRLRVEQLHCGGGTPTFLTDAQFERLFNIISTHFILLGNDVAHDYSIEIDPRSISVEDVSRLADYGFNRFSIGVQDVNLVVQKAVNRIQPMNITESIINACKESKAKSISVDLIYGLPFQTLESFIKTIEAIIEISPDRISLFNYAHLPHLFSPQKRINVVDLPKAETKLQIFKMSIQRLLAAGYVYIGMDHFAKPDDELTIAQSNASLQRNFQGYTTHAQLNMLAVGVSSISCINDFFCQNSKDLKEYYALLDQNILPIVRGYKLNHDDVIRQTIIQKISCQFELDFSEIEAIFSLTFDVYFEKECQELAAMQEDGLLSIVDNTLVVSASGRILVRHICMVFDAYLSNHGPNTFSKII